MAKKHKKSASVLKLTHTSADSESSATRAAQSSSDNSSEALAVLHTTQTSKRIGRPSKYSEELADRICLRIATSADGIHTICREDGMPHPSQVFRWLNDKDKLDFRDKYAHAKELQAEFLVSEMCAIADDASRDDTPFTGGVHVQRAKLKVDTRKWIASKLFPKKYGDKVDITSDGKSISPPSWFDSTPLNKK